MNTNPEFKAPPAFPAWFKQNASEVERAIEILCSQTPEFASLLSDATKHGRKLRSALSLQLIPWTGWEMLGHQKQAIIQSLACIEILHAASCILDDIIDGDRLRHGLPVFYVRNGLPQGILTALLMLTVAFNPSSTSSEFSFDLIRATHDTVIGEGWDTFLFNNGRVLPIDDTLRNYLKKTTPYFALAHELVARNCGRSSGECSASRDYGYYLGAFYQAANDYYDSFHISSAARGDAENEVLVTQNIPLAYLTLKRPDYLGLIGKRITRSALSDLVRVMQDHGVQDDVRTFLDHLKQMVITTMPIDSVPPDLHAFLDVVDSPIFWSYTYGAP